MPTKPQALQTAHLRRAIRKAAHVHANRSATRTQGGRCRSIREGGALKRVRNSKTVVWHKVEGQGELSDACCNIDPQGVLNMNPGVTPLDARRDANGNRRVHNHELCDSLSSKRQDALRGALGVVADDMAKSNRPYAAAAALAARVQVTNGRLEDINAGLWSLVNDACVNRSESGPGKERSK